MSSWSRESDQCVRMSGACVTAERKLVPLRSLHRLRLAKYPLLGSVLLLFLLGCGSGSKSVPSATTTTPSNPGSSGSSLSYPQTTITAIVGQSITPDIPTVSATVRSFGISPVLPAGLTINPTTGTISGTPTVTAGSTTYTVDAETSTGTLRVAIQITVNSNVGPAGFYYPQSTINGYVGTQITPDIPTVPGTPVSFSINIGVPPGLTFNRTTGAISGAPTEAVPATNYTVTAVTSTGTYRAIVQISVASPAANTLTYPVTTIHGLVGEAITPDTPYIASAVSSYSVSPALPAGLSLNSSTGTISGTPTTATPQASYTVTAASSFGSVTAQVSIVLQSPPNVLLNLGQTGQIQELRMAGNRVLSADVNGYWVLWDYTSGAVLAQGDGTQPKIPNPDDPVADNPVVKPVDLAGNTAVVAGGNNLQVFSAVDGSRQSIIAFEGLDKTPAPLATSQTSPWWQLASDGSYICIGSGAGLYLYSPAGQVLVSKQGDYSKAQVFAAPGQVMVADGPAGQTVIETIPTSGGNSSVSQPFSGTFNTWFEDGSHFLTNLNNTVWAYSASGAQQAVMDMPTIGGLGGEGNWIWTYASGSSGYAQSPDFPFSVYPIGSTTPALTVKTGASDHAVISAGTISILSYGADKVTVIDLSGTTPSQSVYSLSTPSATAFAADSASQWVVGTDQGAVIDGASLSNTPRYFGYGAATSIAGANNLAAISTASGKILIINPYSRTQQEVIDFPSTKVMLSSDGSVLAASSDISNITDPSTNQWTRDQTINVYSLPSGSILNSFPDSSQSGSYPQTVVYDFTLAASGTAIGRVTQTYTGTSPAGSETSTPITRTVTPISGGSPIWSDQNDPNPIAFSPDGTLIADHIIEGDATSSTKIIQNGKLVTSVPGAGAGWIDNNRILVNQYVTTYISTVNWKETVTPVIYSAAGVQLAQLPTLNYPGNKLTTIQPVNSGWVYSPNTNAIYSLTSGDAVWTGSYPSTGEAPTYNGNDTGKAPLGAVAGPYIVYQSGAKIVVESY